MNPTTEPSTHQPRLNAPAAAPKVYQAMVALESTVRASGLEPALLELVKLRASQINGCAYCIGMHTREAHAAGESHHRMHLLQAWREAPFYTAREQAALAWTEAVTLVAETHVPDEVFEQARREFSETELTNLTLAVVAINGWNRFAISFRMVPEASAE